MGVAFAIVPSSADGPPCKCWLEGRRSYDFLHSYLGHTLEFAEWYKGIPASSSHTLIGAIVGVGLANALVQGEPVFQAANFRNIEAVFLSLLISPALGFVLAAALLLVIRKSDRDSRLYRVAEGRKPPAWVRAILVSTSSGVEAWLMDPTTVKRGSGS